MDVRNIYMGLHITRVVLNPNLMLQGGNGKTESGKGLPS